MSAIPPKTRSSDYACALILGDRQILLGKRSPHRKTYPNKWDVISGKIETGESAQAALTRELAEEIGIAPLDATFLTTLADHTLNPEDPPRYHFYRVTEWTGGAPYLANHEHSELRWFAPDAIATLSDLALEDYRPLLASVLPG